MKYLIGLSLAALTLYVFIKRTYKYASVQDTVEPPIDYENTQSYKDNEPWFSGMGRCWMKISRRKTHVDINFRGDYLLTKGVLFEDEKGVKSEPEIYFSNARLLVLNKKKLRIRNLKSIFKNKIRVSKMALNKIWLDK